MINRRKFLQRLSAFSAIFIIPLKSLYASSVNALNSFSKASFGENFKWGVATAAFQIEGAWNEDDKSPSVWDTFAQKKRKVHNGEDSKIATDYYHRYSEDIGYLAKMNFDYYRFSTAWTRILPYGTGKVNDKGLDFYKRVCDTCHENNIEPYITLYHWDLPQVLQDKKGWVNRDVLSWFEEYCNVVTTSLSDRCKNWFVLNEPMGFTSLGYLIGEHAPGKIGLRNFFPAVHHACMAQGIGGRIVRANVKNANVGTTFSCSVVEPESDKPKHIIAAKKLDAGLNRLFIEPVLGMGYPSEDLPLLKKLDKYIQPGDMETMPFDFDTIGVQYYFRIVAKKNLVPPLFVKQVKPEKRNALVNTMGLEIYPEGLYTMLKQFGNYEKVDNMVVSECGMAYEDHLTTEGKIHDEKRVTYFKDTLKQVLKAQHDNVPVNGYFVWTLTDNFEWSEGIDPRFGLIYVDYKDNLKRYMKDSALWFQMLLED